jgi:hypothetical protein
MKRTLRKRRSCVCIILLNAASEDTRATAHESYFEKLRRFDTGVAGFILTRGKSLDDDELANS